MNRLLTVCFFLCLSVAAKAQDTIMARIIFLGDAGKISPFQSALISDAASKVISGKTTVMYLGNNIYPDGMALKGHEEIAESKHILMSQYKPMRAKGAAVYFIPGNRDWDNSGPEGLAKIKKEWAFLNEQHDPLLKMIPPNGCPDPVAISISDSLVIITFDSEWWLFPFDKDNPGADCGCTSERDMVSTLRELLYRNRNKTILLATQHPFQSYGTHGGHFSWKDNLFPLTAANPHFYLPLPVAGSLYPLFRKAFPNRENLHDPLYKDMIKNISKVFHGFPNLIQISAHDNGLQLIKNTRTGQTQIVTGIGNKPPYTQNGEYSIFNASIPGYVIADRLPGNRIHFTFYGYKNDTVREVYNYTQGYRPFASWKNAVYAPIKTDSVLIAAHPAYNRIGKFGRIWLGENYRKAWAAPVNLPVLHLDTIKGGLKPVKLGGGFQTTSLRLADPNGREYALRSVNKTPDRVVPKPFRGTFLRELINDATSAQHPYSALMVPPVEEAVGIPHAHPVIGVVAPDPQLGSYQRLFVGKVNLLEEREPLGNSDNYIKALRKLQEDNDNSYNAINFLKARMVDLLFADWDRHGDQWRFYDEHKGNHKYYIIIPRDRDMALNVTQGIVPYLSKRFFLMPHVYGFRKKLLPGSKYYLYKSSFLNANPASQINYDLWMQTAESFKSKVTDSVLEESVACLPEGLDTAKEAQILTDLKARRNKIPEAMNNYYRFSNRIVDIHASNTNEFVSIRGLKDSNALHIYMRKISKHGKLEDTLMSKTYPASITKEIRLYLAKGDDSVLVDNSSSTVRLRIIGGKDHKSYNIINSKKKIKIYDRHKEHYYGKTNKLKIHINDDSTNTAFVPVNLYNTYIPLITGAVNADDGLLLGLGIRFIQQRGFRKTPYTALHKLFVSHSFSTNAFNLKYKGEWLHVFGKADFMLTGDIKAPENTENFFGAGNETPFDKSGNYRRYYRTRFNLYDLEPAVRWHGQKGSTFSIGPAIQYYHFNPSDNTGRFINQKLMLHSFDSAIIAKEKLYLGLIANYKLDRRNDPILPTFGTYVNIRLQGYTGLNQYSKSFAQLIPEVALYKNLNEKQTIVLDDRLGGTITIGKPSFYQYAYLGGQGNLLGYRKYRFAGTQSVYNNFEFRIVLANFGNYLLKGQIGLTGFYDIGRVWIPGGHSHKWHSGTGGGIYIAPASLAVFRLDIGYSEEGWYPYFSMGFRF